MWKCRGCSEQVESNFDSCWNCGLSRDGSKPKESPDVATEALLPNGQLLSEIATSNNASRTRSDIAQALSRRYTDGYRAARSLIFIGTVTKWVAVALALMIFLVSLVFSPGSLGNFVGIGLACAVGLSTFGLGILISGQGQTHLAVLDMAVNTSRHLSKDDVASILFG